MLKASVVVRLQHMEEITHILNDLQKGKPGAAGKLMLSIYDELRRMAAEQMARERPGHTLQATALVNEAYLRLGAGQKFENRRHFFAAAGQAMRRILVENARRKQTRKRGGSKNRIALSLDGLAGLQVDVDAMALEEAMILLNEHDSAKAELVHLRYFAGCTNSQAAEILGLTPKQAEKQWAYARAWLLRQLSK